MAEIQRDVTKPRATPEERAQKRLEIEAAAEVVRAEVETKKAAVQANTARLRALRLDKEAADKARAAEVQAMAKPSARKRDPHAAAGKGSAGRRGTTSR